MPELPANWFVAEAERPGDGTREHPFHDPWLALRHAGPGDVIHIAAGTYVGRYQRSSWVVDCPRLTIRGGYNRDFSRRTPWQTPSVFAAFHDCEAQRESNMLQGLADHSELILDGLYFDAAGRNSYEATASEGISSYPAMDGAIVSFNAEQVIIRHCVFANSSAGGVELSGDGSRFENNLMVNIIGPDMLSIRSAAGGNQQPVSVANNTFCFVHDVGDPPLGTGADRAIGIRVNAAADIHANVFVGCGNAAIGLYRELENVSIDRNLFYLTPRDIVNSRTLGSVASIAEKNIEELEDLGLKSAAGNVVQDPGMAGFKSAWLDAYSRHLLANYARPPRDAANAVRMTAGLPALTPADLTEPKRTGALAPRMAPADALALRFSTPQGYHPTELSTEVVPPSPAPAPGYRAIDWSKLSQADPALGAARVELRAGIGFERNVSLLADADHDTHMSIEIYQPGSDDESIYVLARRYTLPARQYEDASKYTHGREVESTYLVRGVYRTDLQSASRQKVTLMVESISPSPNVAMPPAERPRGRDWFVKAGASGGDGTREKPFRDPFQALEKAADGDAIHVTGGDYFGKLRSGQWKLLTANLTLLGGYDGAFGVRNPWKNPTRFLLDAERKGNDTPDGTILRSDEISDGLILDGFIFDGASYNSYLADGSLDAGHSPLAPLLDLRGGGAPITVRNCLFVNASSAAVSISCPSGILENNIVLNTSGWAVRIRAEGPGPWLIRNNTFLFAADPSPDAGTAHSSADGALLHLTGRAVAVVNANIFAFADNCGVRATIPQQNVFIDNNVFAANLFVHLTDAKYLWANNTNWERCVNLDSAFASFQRNTLALGRLPVDPSYADAALARLFTVPSRFSAAEWKSWAAAVGSSAVPSSSIVSSPAPAASSKSTGGSSLDDLLGQLGAIKDKLAEEKSAKTAATSKPVYCPVFEWSKALALARETPATEPGAHQLSAEIK